MRYTAKIKVVHNGKLYTPGTVLPGTISKADLEFLKAKNYLVPCVDEPESDDFESDDFDEQEPDGEYKTADEIGKMRSKKDVRAYADAIGLDLGADWEEKSLKDLKEAVILYQDEQEAAAEAE